MSNWQWGFPGMTDLSAFQYGFLSNSSSKAVVVQILVLNVEGRVLTPDQMRAGLYILPSEAALATSLLQGGAWVPPSTAQQSAADDPPGKSSSSPVALNNRIRSASGFFHNGRDSSVCTPSSLKHAKLFCIDMHDLHGVTCW